MNNNGRSGLAKVPLVTFFIVSVLVVGSGFVLLALRYLVTPQDPFAPLPSSFPFWQHLHLSLAQALTLLLGFIWARHGGPFLQKRMPRIGSGLSAAVTGVVMIFSGAFYQITTTPNFREFFRLLHTTSGISWFLIVLAHLLIRRRANGPESANGQTAVCQPEPEPLNPGEP